MRRSAALVLLMAAALLAAPASASNDPLFSRQWGLTQVRAPQAWATSQGAGVVVAVIDTGVDMGHPDLSGQVIKGPDYINDDNNPQDDHGHGTHVSGIIAALKDNGEGVSGVAPRSKILAIKVLDEFLGLGSFSDVLRAIDFAVNNGARVINLSLGDIIPIEDDEESGYDRAIRSAAQRDVVVVAAAGNDGYPFADPRTADVALIVGATNKSDQRALYSNSGPGVNIWAPGGGDDPVAICEQDVRVWSTIWPNPRPNEGGNCGHERYAQQSGTSMAAPHVAGVAALVRSINPSLSAAQVRQIILSTADTITGRHKRVNAARAVAATPRPGGGSTGGGGGAPPSGDGGGSTGGGGASSGSSGGGGAATSSQASPSPEARENSDASPTPQAPGDRRSVAEPEEGGGFPFALGAALVLLLLGAGGGAYWYVFARKRG